MIAGEIGWLSVRTKRRHAQEGSRSSLIELVAAVTLSHRPNPLGSTVRRFAGRMVAKYDVHHSDVAWEMYTVLDCEEAGLDKLPCEAWNNHEAHRLGDKLFVPRVWCLLCSREALDLAFAGGLARRYEDVAECSFAFCPEDRCLRGVCKQQCEPAEVHVFNRQKGKKKKKHVTTRRGICTSSRCPHTTGGI